MADAYTHPQGWNDPVNFPTKPTSEAQARALLQEQHDEMLAFHNAHMVDYTTQVPYGGATTGLANTYVLAAPTIAALTAGMAVAVKINVDSTAASTLNWDGKGAKGIKTANGSDFISLKKDGIYTMRYDGANFILQGEGASGNATASDLRLGKTASTDAGYVTGTSTAATATGTVTSSSSTINFKMTDNNVQARYTVTVSGLTFTPSIIIVKLMGLTGSAPFKPQLTIYVASGLATGTYPCSIMLVQNGSSSPYTVTGPNLQLDGTSAYVNETGFRMPVFLASTDYEWEAKG